MVVTDAIKNYTMEKLDRLNKYFTEEDMTANVLTRVRGNKQIVEVTIPTDKFILRSEESHDDLYAAIDLVSDKLERQIRKNKTRIMSKKNKNEYDFSLSEIELNDESEENNNKVIKRKKIDIKPMDEEEAILQMELLGHQFYVYKDSTSNKMAVIYKRNDGNYGVIESE